MPITRKPASASTSRFSTRYEAKAMASSTFAASAGWKLYGPTWIQIWAPNLSVPNPGTSGSSMRIKPMRPNV